MLALPRDSHAVKRFLSVFCLGWEEWDRSSLILGHFSATGDTNSAAESPSHGRSSRPKLCSIAPQHYFHTSL